MSRTGPATNAVHATHAGERCRPPKTSRGVRTGGWRWSLRLAGFVVASLLPRLAPAANLDIHELLARLAKPAPATIRYTEVRYSSLLSAPLVVSGQLAYLGPGILERRVEEPFHETTRIHGEDVIVTRDGEPPTRFSLKRAPELRSMLGAFGALLAGNRASLEQAFSYRVEGDEARWRIDLTPRDARTRTRLDLVRVDGARDQPRCLTLIEPDGDADFMLLGAVATAPLPPALDRAALEARCAGGAD